MKRIYIPLPEASTRRSLIEHLMSKQHSALGSSDLAKLVKLTEGRVTTFVCTGVNHGVHLYHTGSICIIWVPFVLHGSHLYHLGSICITWVPSFLIGYSCSDITALAKEAAIGPIRDLGYDAILSVAPESVRPIQYSDYLEGLKVIRPSVAPSSLAAYEEWNRSFGGTG